MTNGEGLTSDGMVFDANGDMFLTEGDGSLVEVNPSLTSVQTVGNTGVSDLYGLAWSDGALYGFGQSQDAIYQINPATAATTSQANLNPSDGVQPAGVEGATSLPSTSVSLPDIVMNSVSTSDSKSVMFIYCIENGNLGQGFQVVIYRATANQFNPNDPNFTQDYQRVATVNISSDQATEGSYVSAPVSVPCGLSPEPSHPYVLAVANPNETVPEPNYQNDSAAFHIYTVAVVVPGWGYTATQDPPQWITDMDNLLMVSNSENAAGKPSNTGGADYDSRSSENRVHHPSTTDSLDGLLRWSFRCA